MERRRFLQSALLAAASPSSPSSLGIPGPYRGRVVSVYHPGSIISGAFQAQPIQQMMRKGMMELTGAPGWVDAWRVFFQPGDIVGIKVNPVGQPHCISCAETFREIVAGLEAAGVKRSDIFGYDRYRDQFLSGGFDKWLPDGVRWAWASGEVDKYQLDMDGYDRDQYMEMALKFPEQDWRDSHVRRSYVAKFLSKQINKLVTLCVLKHHQSAGMTVALKNLSHGLVNNVNRSHISSTLNACGTFIPAVVNLPVFRQKCVLHICDGIQAAYHGGPGGRVVKYLWEHKTMYFATDPVALDRIGWRVIDDKRVEQRMQPIALSKPDDDSNFLNCQIEYIEIAGALGLGEFDEEKIQWQKFQLS